MISKYAPTWALCDSGAMTRVVVDFGALRVWFFSHTIPLFSIDTSNHQTTHVGDLTPLQCVLMVLYTSGLLMHFRWGVLLPNILLSFNYLV